MNVYTIDKNLLKKIKRLTNLNSKLEFQGVQVWFSTDLGQAQDLVFCALGS